MIYAAKNLRIQELDRKWVLKDPRVRVRAILQCVCVCVCVTTLFMFFDTYAWKMGSSSVYYRTTLGMSCPADG